MKNFKSTYSRIPHRQHGVTLIEVSIVLAVAAIIAIAVLEGGPFVRNHARSYQLNQEMAHFASGILSATASDSDFSTITTAAMVQNDAFQSAGSRVSLANGTVTGIWQGDITVQPETVNTANDGAGLTYPNVPSGVCAVAVQGLKSSFPELTVNGTVIVSPTVTFTDAAAGAACNSANSVDIVAVVTRTQ